MCFNTDSRSCPVDEAVERVTRTAAHCRLPIVTHVFKKVDSVLRGWVMAELCALLPALNCERALLVPANPARGRVIRDGQYWIDGKLLHETDFARDPEHPVQSAGVLALLGKGATEPVSVLPVGSRLPSRGIVVGEATCPVDLSAWASRLDASTLPAGAAEFFAAFLESIGHPKQREESILVRGGAPGRALFVCGSTADASRAFLRRSEAGGLPVLGMPHGLLDGGSPRQQLLEQWSAAVAEALQEHARAVVAIAQPLQHGKGMPQRLSHLLAVAVQQVLGQQPVDHLLVEGGATAMALVSELGWTRLVVECQFAPGVVGLRPVGPAGPLVVIKPGSYPWPEELAGQELPAGNRFRGSKGVS
jgi:uncharacterized protein YgbK (DUF1537 family)